MLTECNIAEVEDTEAGVVSKQVAHLLQSFLQCQVGSWQLHMTVSNKSYQTNKQPYNHVLAKQTDI